MRTRTFSLVTVLASLALAPSVAACRFDQVDSPAPFETNDEAAELAALDIGDDEPIGDEEDLGVPEEQVTGSTFDELGERVPSGEADAENPIPEEQASDEDVADDAIEAGDVAAQTLRPNVAPGAIPSSERRVNIGWKTWRCSQKTSRACVCEGSPLNCELPNDQPGRNRYLPPSKVNAIQTRGGDKAKMIEEIGKWEIARDTPIYDGTGHRRGDRVFGSCYELVGTSGAASEKIDGKTCVKINFGQKKTMSVDGEASKRAFVYAFAVSVDGKLAASGWIPLAKVVKKAELTKMPRVTTPRVANLSSASYVVKSARDWGQAQATFSSDKLPSWAQGRVVKGDKGARPAMVKDYLLRDGNVINLAFHTPGVGGAAADTLFVADDALAFKRARSTTAVPTLVRVRVYHPKKKSMIFAYGEIGGRFGWLPLVSFKKGTVAESVKTKDSCVGKPDGLHCSELAPWSAYFCEGGTISSGVQCAELTDRCTGPTPDKTNIVCAAQ